MSTIRDESLKHYAMVSKLIHYSSKFSLNDDGRHTKPHQSIKNHRLSSNLDSTDKFVLFFLDFKNKINLLIIII